MRRLTTIDNVLSTDECRQIIRRLEELGFRDQHSGDGNRVIRTRCVLKDEELVARLWPRVRLQVASLEELYDDEFTPEPAVVQPLDEFDAVGLNEMLRCYKYRRGEQFRRHEDFAHEWDESKRTFLTVLFYLNEDYDGGETEFENAVVTPRTGLAAVFPHELEHAGRPVTSGVKYALRSDVVFARRNA